MAEEEEQNQSFQDENKRIFKDLMDMQQQKKPGQAITANDPPTKINTRF